MRRKAIGIFLMSLCFSRADVPAKACCEGEPPEECYICEDGVWVQYGDCSDGCPSCYGCVNCNCQCVAEVLGVGSLLYDSACVKCYIPFVAGLPSEQYCGCVHWSGGGNPASQDGGCIFSTRWDTTGTKTVTASTCKNSKSMQVTIAAPTNFHLVEWWDIGNGEICIYYQWESTSGNLAHLSGCDVGEIVIYYPAGNPYIPPNPPFDNWRIDNPTVRWPSMATDGGVWDTHKRGGGFSKPYCNRNFIGYQRERYRTCLGTISDFWGPVSITREVYQLVTDWYYSTTKEGAYATAPIPP